MLFISLPRYVINFDELVDSLFKKDKNDFVLNTGTQLSKGFFFDKTNNEIEWEYKKDIVINNIVIGANSHSVLSNISLNLYIKSKLGKKNYILDNVYIKDIYEQKTMLSMPLLEISDIMCVEVNNLKDADNVFLDIDFLLV